MSYQVPPTGPPQGWPPPYPHGHPPPPPPKKSHPALWAGLAIGGALLLIVAITGFVAPGFFLSRDTTGAAPAPTERPVTAPPETEAAPTSSAANSADRLAEAKAVAQRFIDKLNAGDNDGAADELGCPDSSKNLLKGQIIVTFDPPTKLTLGDVTEQGFIFVGFSGTSQQTTVSGRIRVQALPGSPMCVRLLDRGR